MHHDPARSEPDASDASLRAALDHQLAANDHLRELSRRQGEDLRRPLVRVARGVDRRARRLSATVARRRDRVRRRLARLVLLTASLPSRPVLGRRRTRLDLAVRGLAPVPVAGRRVSIIVVADGPLDPLPPLDAIDHEVVLVLNGVDVPTPEDVDSIVITSHRITTTAAAIRGAARASSPALCFLAPTSEPLRADWLSRLVAVLDDDTVATTPMLVHPERPPLEATPHDLQVRELGLDIVVTDRAGPRMKARQAGTEPVPTAAVVEVAAGSSACLVVDRAAFDEVGGLAPIEDIDAALVDLCGRLQAGHRRIAAVPSSVVVDHRPVRSRRALEAPLDPNGAAWRTVVHRQGAALARIARGQHPDDHLRLALTVSVPSARAATRWGDWHLADALGRSLRRRGHAVRVQRADQADDLASRSCDVQIVLRGVVPTTRTPGQRHILWIISHPESVDPRECDDADLVLVASERYAAHLRSLTTTPVEVLLQATDHLRFRPRPPEARHAHAVAVVATTRHVFRPVVASALAAGLRPAIYGDGWHEFVDDELIVAEFVPNQDLPVVYSSVGVLLNDHWETMRRWGFVSNRIFDALACATPVVSDHMVELESIFGDSVATYSDGESLGRAVQHALDDPVGARHRAEAGRELVLAHHTFDHRADELLDMLARHHLVPGAS